MEKEQRRRVPAGKMKTHCCDIMTNEVNKKCHQHSDPFGCPDHLVSYSEKLDEYGIIIHDGGSSSSAILFCPWCGSNMPESKRELWFEELEKLGIDDPWEQEIPEEFETGKWREKL